MVKDSMDEGLPGHSKPNSSQSMYIGFAVVVVIVGIGGFLGGIQYQKSTAASTAIGTQSGSGQLGGGGGLAGGGPGARRAGGFGTVTTVSASSITIAVTQFGNSDPSASTSKTYTINSSTTVTNAGAAASVSDIQAGDRVIVRTSPSDNTTATSIMVNPTFGGGGGAPSGQTQSGSSTNSSNPSSST